MGHSPKKRVFRHSLRLESLERRDVFASDLAPQADYLIIDSRGDVPLVSERDAVLRAHISNKYYDFNTSGKFTTVASESQLDAKVQELVGQYWQGVFGMTLADLAQIHNPYSPWFSTLPSAGQLSFTAASADSVGLRSITNVRHTNIDEADSSELSSDGFLYTVLNNSVHVADLRDPRALSASPAVDVQDNNARLFVAGDRLIILQTVARDPVGSEQLSPFYPQQTKISIYDITDRISPRAVSTKLIDGSNRSAFLANGQLTLVQDNQIALPAPEMVTDTSGVKRFVDFNTYYAANRAAIFAILNPDYGQAAGDATPKTFEEAGDWEDVSFANDSLGQSTSVWKFGLADGDLTLIDSETITGMSASLVYQGQEDIYLVLNPVFQSAQQSLIYKIDTTVSGQLQAVEAVEVVGRIDDTSWMNEHEGVLQVASLGRADGANAVAPIDRPDQLFFIMPPTGANITTIGDFEGSWQVLGSLTDIAPGQSLLAANFIGDRAVLTTGTTTASRRFDPLHGIDLSDPAHPVEMSELTIPGFTTYLKQIDETHWVGLGFDERLESQLQSHLQVSLYEVSDLANPVVVDTWVSPDIGWWGGWDAHSISYDESTGLLTFVTNQQFANGNFVPVPIFKIDPSSDEPLKVLGSAALNDFLYRGFTLDDVYVAVTLHAVTTYDVDDLSQPLDKAYLKNFASLNWLYWTVPVDGTQTWNISDFWKGEPFEITKIETRGGIEATLNADQTITLKGSSQPVLQSQELAVTLKFESGHTRTIKIWLQSYNAFYFPEPAYSMARGSVQARFTDDAGVELTEVSAGDEVWVTFSASDSRDVPSGVFAAYVNVAFDSQNITVISDVEHLGGFINGVEGTVSTTGIRNLGGFAGSTPSNVGLSDIARFKIRVENDQQVTLSIMPSTDLGKEFLVYGESRALNPANISTSVLATRTTTVGVMVTDDTRTQDLNSDGMITALDVLQVVNYINAQLSTAEESTAKAFAIGQASAESSAYDLTGDGVISAADVLQIVNTINARYGVIASGEDSSLSPEAVDYLFAVDLDTLPRKRL